MKKIFRSAQCLLHDILVSEKVLRATEVVSILFGSIIIGLATLLFLWADKAAKEKQNDILETQVHIQTAMTNMLKEKTDTGIISTLLSRVCTDQEMALVVNELSTITDTLDRASIFRIIQKQCKIATLPEGNQQNTNVEIDYNKMNTSFRQEVNAGGQYYRSHLWQAAADTWNRAIIPPFLAKSLINNAALKEARLALGRGEPAKAADLFRDAFKEVGSYD